MIIYQAGRINQFILIILKAAEPTVCRQNEGRASYRPDYFFKKKAIPNKRDSFTVHRHSLIVFLNINDSLRIRNINAVGIKGVLDLGHGIVEYR